MCQPRRYIKGVSIIDEERKKKGEIHHCPIQDVDDHYLHEIPIENHM